MHGSWAPWSMSNFPCLCSWTFTFSHPVDKHKYCVVSSLPCFQSQHVIFWKLPIIQSASWVYLSINTWYYGLWLCHWVHSQRTLLLLVLCCFCVTIELRLNRSVKLHLPDTEEPATAPTSRGMKVFAQSSEPESSSASWCSATLAMTFLHTEPSPGTTSIQEAEWLICNWNVPFKLKWAFWGKADSLEYS